MAIDVNRLKRDLMDYYGTAMYNGFPVSGINLGKIKNASLDILEKLAEDAGIDLEEYEDEIDR